MPAPQVIPYGEVTLNITAEVMSHPRDLSKVLATRYGVSRATSANVLRRLETEGWVSRSGPSTHPVFTPGYKRSRTFSRPLPGLEEDKVWEDDVAPYLLLTSNVRNIVHHGFTEMVNNAIDHSEGKQVLVHVLQDQSKVELLVSDDGIGIFRKISEAMQLPDVRLAMFELAKGKLTTDPSKHSGEGVFFTSRMFDDFGIHANGLYFSHEDQAPRDWLLDAAARPGTAVHMRIAVNSARTSREVFEQYMNAPEDYGFNKTVVPMKLAQLGSDQLLSRSQAKRLIARFDRFRTVMLDFSGVPEIGQAFADEIFRVYARQHPNVELIPSHMTEQVERMRRRALRSDVAS